MASRNRASRGRRGGLLGALVQDSASLAAIQTVWFELRELPWRTLAVVPAEARVCALETTAALASVATRFEGGEVFALDGRVQDLDECRERMAEMRRLVDRGSRVILAIDHPLSSPLALPLARAAETAVLLVVLESSRIREARAVVHRVGEEHFAGGLALKLQRKSRASRRGGRAGAPEPAWVDMSRIIRGSSGGGQVREEGGA